MPLLGFLTTEMVAVSIPVLFIFGGIAVAIVAIIMSARTKELQHKERLLAMEKGIELPTEPREEKRPGYQGNRTGGFIMLFLGLALTVALFATTGKAGVWGFLPMAIGVGLLVSAELERREYIQRRGQSQ